VTKKSRIGSHGQAGLADMLNLSGEVIDPKGWVKVDEMAMTEDRRAEYLVRKGAIEAYFEGKSDADIRKSWGLGRDNVHRIITTRCLSRHPDGKLWGWRGAIPHVRVVDWSRKTPPSPGLEGEGTAGSLQWLFSRPELQKSELEKRFRERILELPTGLKGTRDPKIKLVHWFLDDLRAVGWHKKDEWPFNAERRGYTTICKFITKVLNGSPSRQIELLGGTEAVRKARAGDGTNRPHFRLFQRVECDAHKLDIRMVVMVRSPHGGYEPRKIHRLWVIVILEVETRAVLGYYLSMRREVAAEDVLRGARNALSMWGRREISFSEQPYAPGAALPSGWNPKYLGTCWDEFSVDGALANVCARVKEQLERVVGCRILSPMDKDSYSSRRSLDDRPYIEAFFSTLSQRGLHGLSPSTKSKPEDLKGDGDPAAKAEAVQFQLEYLEELLDVLIANYNATPQTGLGSRSPLHQLNYLCEASGDHLRIADPGEVGRLGATRKLCTLLGGAHTGRRPYFNFENARYSSELLMKRPDLIGQRLWLCIENPDDARWATVTDQQGIFICAVRAAPPWHRLPHSLFVRSAIRSLEARRLLFLTGTVDAVEELIKYGENVRDKKLPVHPAMLEAFRILKTHADNLSIESPLSEPEPEPEREDRQVIEYDPKGACDTVDPFVELVLEVLGSESTVDSAPKQKTPLEKPKPKLILPPRRQARTW